MSKRARFGLAITSQALLQGMLVSAELCAPAVCHVPATRVKQGAYSHPTCASWCSTSLHFEMPCGMICTDRARWLASINLPGLVSGLLLTAHQLC